MRWLWFAAALAFATSANAVALSVTANKTTYYVGETITVSVVGDDTGATSYGIFGRLVYNGLLIDNGTRSQLALNGPSGAWVRGALQATDTNVYGPTSASSEAFNQITFSAQGANNLPGQLSTVTLIAQNVGVVALNWDTTAPGFQLDFFGLTSAPGTSFTIIDCDGASDCPAVPEPATGALLALGLIGLGCARRPRDAR